MLALCIYREARGEGTEGQIAVACVIRNRVRRNMTSYYSEIVKPWQFSSITAKGDPQLSVWPNILDTTWKQCQDIAAEVANGTVPDPTGGATLYYADSIPFPASWNRSKVAETVKIGHQTFFREVA